jgi:hypothetical protein
MFDLNEDGCQHPGYVGSMLLWNLSEYLQAYIPLLHKTAVRTWNLKHFGWLVGIDEVLLSYEE